MNPACPACGAGTQLVRWDDATGLECGSCGGHLVRSEALRRFFALNDIEDRLEKLMVEVRSAPAARRALACPDCPVSDYRVLPKIFVEIDVCAGCIGAYFDRDEATQYFRQTRFKSSGGDIIDGTVTAMDGLGAILDILSKFGH